MLIEMLNDVINWYYIMVYRKMISDQWTRNWRDKWKQSEI